MKVAIKNSTRKITFITKTSSTTAFPFNLTTSNNDLFDDGNGSEFLNSLSLLTLIILYGIVVFSGVFGNSTLLISLCSQSTTRVKNPLLLALCAADLLVTMVSAPLTIIGVLLRQSKTASFSMANIGCKVFHYMQVICGFSIKLKSTSIIHVVWKWLDLNTQLHEDENGKNLMQQFSRFFFNGAYDKLHLFYFILFLSTPAKRHTHHLYEICGILRCTTLRLADFNNSCCEFRRMLMTGGKDERLF